MVIDMFALFSLLFEVPGIGASIVLHGRSGMAPNLMLQNTEARRRATSHRTRLGSSA